MTQLERELLRLYVEAEDLVNEKYNAETFATLAKRPLTPEERLEMVKFEYLHLIPNDAVVAHLLWRLCLVTDG